MAIIQIPGFKCDVCGHEWISKNRDLTDLHHTCPKCNSSDWNINTNKPYNPKSNMKS